MKIICIGRNYEDHVSELVNMMSGETPMKKNFTIIYFLILPMIMFLKLIIQTC